MAVTGGTQTAPHITYQGSGGLLLHVLVTERRLPASRVTHDAAALCRETTPVSASCLARFGIFYYSPT